MPSLTERAERALLGALLLDPAQLARLPVLEVTDFRMDSHRSVFEHLRYAGAHGDHAGLRLNGDLVAAPPGYTDVLRRSCPDPAHAPAYARLVIEAMLRRELSAHAQRLRTAAADLHYHGARLAAGAQPGDAAEDLLYRDMLVAQGDLSYPPVQRLLCHELELAIALRAHAAAFDPDRDPARAEHEVAAVPEPAPPVLGVPGPASIAAWYEAAGLRPCGPLSREAREELVLASVLQRDDAARAIPNWLPASAMTGPRRELLTAITALARRGDPVDEVTADWELTRARSLTGAQPGDTAYAARVVRLSVGAGTAVTIAHDLYREHTAASDRMAAVLPHAAGTAAGSPETPAVSPHIRPPSPPHDAGPTMRM